jgi:hypothetical protein
MGDEPRMTGSSGCGCQDAVVRMRLSGCGCQDAVVERWSWGCGKTTWRTAACRRLVATMVVSVGLTADRRAVTVARSDGARHGGDSYCSTRGSTRAG